MAPYRACSNQGSRLAKSVQGGWQYLIPVSVVFRFLTAHHKNVRICLTEGNTMEYIVMIYKKIIIDDVTLHDYTYNKFF